jgi:hypothetical protein
VYHPYTSQYQNFSQSVGCYELKKHKPWFDKGCSKLSKPKKKGDNFRSVRCEATGHFRNKKREYMKDRINDLATVSKNKNSRDLYRGVN